MRQDLSKAQKSINNILKSYNFELNWDTTSVFDSICVPKSEKKTVVFVEIRFKFLKKEKLLEAYWAIHIFSISNYPYRAVYIELYESLHNLYRNSK